MGRRWRLGVAGLMGRRWRLGMAGLLAGLAVVVGSAGAARADDSVTAMCNSQPCADQWYTVPVFLSWSWTGGSANPPCSEQYYSSDVEQTVSCTVVFPDGSTTRNYILRIEISSPTGTAAAVRPPDSNGWYNHPVTVQFGIDSISGQASCTAPITYSGPSAANVTLSGSCTDNAGKSATASASFNYDATPPTITAATPSRRPDYDGSYTHAVVFTFHGSDGLSGIERCQTVPYSGPASGWVTGGCWDRAGNYASRSFWVPYLAVISQARAARASVGAVPLLLRWRPRWHASYYNVQIYRAGRKILSRWPAAALLLVARRWWFDRHLFRLKPGRYRWYVWPGYGPRAADRYGPMIVSRSFTVT